MKTIYHDYYYAEYNEYKVIVAIHSAPVEDSVKVTVDELQKIKLGKTKLSEIKYVVEE